MKKLIRVSSNDIENGKRYNCTCCPVGLAITRAFSDLKYTAFVSDIISLFDVDGHNLYLTKCPPDVKLFIDKFDDGEKVLPFSVELEFIEFFDKSAINKL